MQDTTAPTTCPHGLRPGTTVCLHCRREARAAARQRRNRFLARMALATLGTGAVVALIIGAVVSLKPDGRALADQDAARPSADVAPSGATVTSSGGAPVSAPTTTTGTPQAGTARQPIVAEGRTELGEGMYATRDGAQVTVNFDTDLLRTRFDWKFEGVVRATLPLVYGPDTRVALDSIPVGSWVRGGDLLIELPQRGVPLAVGDHTIRIWPITREGRDGPIVVGYRAALGR